MMWMLAELYHALPEAGDLDRPRLVFFFDEAHLLFNEASKAFLRQVEQVVRLIRSKGVGVCFVTQTPKDVPADVLAQLSNRVQHALRAHTPDDEAALNATVRTFPKTGYYDFAETLTSLGIGEAVVTVLDPGAAVRAGAPPAAPPPAGSGGRSGMSAGAKIGTAVVAALGTTMARAVGRELIRGVFGMLTGKAPRGTSRRRW